MANNIHPAISHTGGGAGALDAIDGNDIADGDGALVITETNHDHYVVDGTIGESESYPRIILPDTNPGTKGYRRTHCRDNFIYSRKQSADTPDDEFESTTLNGKWTAVSGASGTVDLFEAGAVSKYDLSTRPDWLLIQNTGGQLFELRQDHTLADGASIVAAICPATGFDDAIAADQKLVGISVNDSDAGYTSGNYSRIWVDTDAGSSQIVSFDSSAVRTTAGSNPWGVTVFFRIARVGLVYHMFYSFNGYAWCGMGSTTAGSAYSNIWIWADGLASDPDPVGIHAVKWVRQGTNNLDPWGI